MFTFLSNLFFAIIQFIPSIYSYIKEWWKFKRPAGLVFENLINNKKTLRIFVKDLIVPNNTFLEPKLFSIEGNVQQANPNISKVWPEVEGKGIGLLQNLLGQMGKKDKIEIIEMSKGHDLWDSDFIILGAQAVKCREFYEVMEKVGYYVDEHSIYDKTTKKSIEMEAGHGYGLIIKAEKNNSAGKINGILLGGFGVLGTAASIYYFAHNVNKLGDEFENKPFSIVVRAREASGEQSTIRLKKYDKQF